MTNYTRGFSPYKLYIREEDPMRRKRSSDNQTASEILSLYDAHLAAPRKVFATTT